MIIAQIMGIGLEPASLRQSATSKEARLRETVRQGKWSCLHLHIVVADMYDVNASKFSNQHRWIFLFWVIDPNLQFRFGVCCVFTFTGDTATTNNNCSYLQNPGFPGAFNGTTTATTVTYTVQKCSDGKRSVILASSACFCLILMKKPRSDESRIS